MMCVIVLLGPQQQTLFELVVTLSQNLHANTADTFMLTPKRVVSACDVALHPSSLTAFVLANNLSCLKLLVSQSLKSASSITMEVPIHQHNSVLSVNRTWRQSTSSSNA